MGIPGELETETVVAVDTEGPLPGRRDQDRPGHLDGEIVHGCSDHRARKRIVVPEVGRATGVEVVDHRGGFGLNVGLQQRVGDHSLGGGQIQDRDVGLVIGHVETRRASDGKPQSSRPGTPGCVIERDRGPRISQSRVGDGRNMIRSGVARLDQLESRLREPV